MPYINKFDRKKHEALVKLMKDQTITSPGELNYLLTELIHVFLGQIAESYQNYNDALGALEGCKLELYRRHIAKYEDQKIEINGDVP